MLRKVRFIIVLISLSICLCLMSNTYSRYVAGTASNIELLFAKWQILISDIDITNDSETTINFVPIIEENEYVADNVIAPSSKGYFDIAIDPSNVGVSFKYSVNLEMENEEVPDLTLTKYSIIPYDYIEGDTLDIIPLEENIITDSLYFDKDNEDFQYSPFTIRIYFEWYEGEDELMDDKADSYIGHLATTEDVKLKMNATISFEQIIQ